MHRCPLEANSMDDASRSEAQFRSATTREEAARREVSECAENLTGVADGVARRGAPSDGGGKCGTKALSPPALSPCRGAASWRSDALEKRGRGARTGGGGQRSGDGRRSCTGGSNPSLKVADGGHEITIAVGGGGVGRRRRAGGRGGRRAGGAAAGTEGAHAGMGCAMGIATGCEAIATGMCARWGGATYPTPPAD